MLAPNNLNWEFLLPVLSAFSKCLGFSFFVSQCTERSTIILLSFEFLAARKESLNTAALSLYLKYLRFARPALGPRIPSNPFSE